MKSVFFVFLYFCIFFTARSFTFQDMDGNWVVEWDYESLLSLHSAAIDMRVTRVGFLRYGDGIKPEEEDAVAKALLPFSCVPVFLERSLAQKFYRDFCKVGFLFLWWWWWWWCFCCCEVLGVLGGVLSSFLLCFFNILFVM